MATKFDDLFPGSNKLLWLVRILFVFMITSIAADTFIRAMDSLNVATAGAIALAARKNDSSSSNASSRQGNATAVDEADADEICLLYTSPSPRD